MRVAWQEEKYVFGQKKALGRLTHARDNLKIFLTQYVDGSLMPTLQSEPVPEPSSNTKSPIKVVGNSFLDVVRSGKSLLLLAYAPCEFVA